MLRARSLASPAAGSGSQKPCKRLKTFGNVQVTLDSEFVRFHQKRTL